MKRCLSLLLSVMLLMFAFSATAADLRVTLNDQEITQVQDVMREGATVFAPARAVCDALGYKTDWDGEKMAAIVTTSDYVVEIGMNTTQLMQNGTAFPISAATFTTDDGRLFLPLDAFGAFGLAAGWNEQTGTLAFRSVKDADVLALSEDPVITPAGGTDDDPVDTFEQITITHPAASVGRVYYTLDGSEPTLNSIQYTGPFTANGHTDIHAAAIASDGRKTNTVEAYIYGAVWSATATEFRLDGENTVNNAKIAWTPYPGADSYLIYRGGDLLIGHIAGEVADDYGLALDTTYTYTVKALQNDQVIAESVTNAITTFSYDLNEVTETFDNITGSYITRNAAEPRPGGHHINGAYYRYYFSGVSREEFTAAGFDGKIWDDVCQVVSIRQLVSADGITWPEREESTIVYPLFIDMRLEGAGNCLHYDEETVVFTGHAEGTNGYNAAKLFLAAFKPGRTGQNVQPYGVTVAGGLILPLDNPMEQYEEIQNPAANQLSSYYVGRPFSYDSRDMVRFVDGEDAYIFSAVNMNSNTGIFKLDKNWTKPEKVMQIAFRGKRQESPSVIRDTDGTYYFYSSTANGWYPTQARYASTTALDQPWSPMRQIANAGTFATQANGIWSFDSESGRLMHRAHGYHWGGSFGGQFADRTYERFFPMAINHGVATASWFYQIDYHPYWGAIAVQSARFASLGKNATCAGKPAAALTDGGQLQQSPSIGDLSSLPYDMIVDLETPTVITEVNFTTGIVVGSTTVSSFVVEGSNDQQSWTMLADRRENNDPGFVPSAITDKTPYRYVRVTVDAVTNMHNNNSALWGGKPIELAIYGNAQN